MATARDTAKISADDLLEAAKQLSASELERLVSQLLFIQARRRTPNLSEAETTLMLRINEGLSDEKWERYHNLVEKQHEANLTQDETRELRSLIDEIEHLTVNRVQALGELALLRGVPIQELMQSLGINQRPVL